MDNMTGDNRYTTKGRTWKDRREFISRIGRKIAKRMSWLNFVKFICLVIAISLIAALVIRIVSPNALSILTDIKPEYILLALAVTLLFPYISNIEALGVKISIKEQVNDLSAWADASSYYPLATDYQSEGDFFLAEKYFNKCLEKSGDYWPALFRLGVLYDEKDEKTLQDWDKAISYYKRVLEIDKDNFYSDYNLAAAYLNAPRQIKDPEKALYYANKMLDQIPSYTDAIYFKGEALNYLGRYKEASDTLNTINKDQMKDYFWVSYELAIADFNKEEKITQDILDKMKDNLDKIYEAAEKAGKEASETNDFLKALEENLKQFKDPYHPLVKTFLDEKKPKTDVTG